MRKNDCIAHNPSTQKEATVAHHCAFVARNAISIGNPNLISYIELLNWTLYNNQMSWVQGVQKELCSRLLQVGTER